MRQIQNRRRVSVRFAERVRKRFVNRSIAPSTQQIELGDVAMIDRMEKRGRQRIDEQRSVSHDQQPRGKAQRTRRNQRYLLGSGREIGKERIGFALQALQRLFEKRTKIRRKRLRMVRIGPLRTRRNPTQRAVEVVQSHANVIRIDAKLR